jgi:hypothetical protein
VGGEGKDYKDTGFANENTTGVFLLDFDGGFKDDNE